ncbi:uncharacterized protein BX664DRAFT_263589 [Halteromyces radiatus]|uniref:uncharacterized protein n=1 Tax=Halteromyces radiatus TaxID=101107 RepID=UPI00221EC906|nr:uncharacterized protein BX664DRAFT_263589 [Halteromyces radiatus]KAI8089881.1 hypothetical protein BX664DRAFT_263589 [Halteromyces radiatus]
MVARKGLFCLGLVFLLILSTVIPTVKAWEKGNEKKRKVHFFVKYHIPLTIFFFYYFDHDNIDDFEIFDLVDELEKAEGKETNFYNWLNLKPSATQAEISKAYRKLSIKLHPDKNKHDAQAEERFARLGKVAAILRNAGTRERYNHFYKNGVPRWRGTGYYYARFRPGVGSVIVFLMLLAASMQYLAKWINYYQEKSKIIQFVQDARANLNVNVPKGYGAPTLGRSYLEVGHRTLRCEIKSDHYIIIHMENKDEEPVHLNTEWVLPPRFADIYLVKWPLGLIHKLQGKHTDDNQQDNKDSHSDEGSEDKQVQDKTKKKKSKATEPVNVTGTKVGGRRRALRK